MVFSKINFQRCYIHLIFLYLISPRWEHVKSILFSGISIYSVFLRRYLIRKCNFDENILMNIYISCIYGFCCPPPIFAVSVLSSLNMILHLLLDEHPFIVYLRQISFTDTGYNTNSWFKMSISRGVNQTQLCSFYIFHWQISWYWCFSTHVH